MRQIRDTANNAMIEQGEVPPTRSTLSQELELTLAELLLMSSDVQKAHKLYPGMTLMFTHVVVLLRAVRPTAFKGLFDARAVVHDVVAKARNAHPDYTAVATWRISRHVHLVIDVGHRTPYMRANASKYQVRYAVHTREWAFAFGPSSRDEDRWLWTKLTI